MLADNERRLIGLFRQFMEKSIVPTIKNYGSVMNDWLAFNAALGQEDLGKIQSFVESKASAVKMFPVRQEDKLKTNSGFLKRKEDLATPESPVPEAPGTYTFSSNKTFGGDRARLNMFPLKPQGGTPTTTVTPIPEKKEEGGRFQAVDRILTSIESLYKTLSDNQQRFEQPGHHATAPVAGGGGLYRYEDRKYDRM